LSDSLKDNNQGVLIIISAPSGCGKTTIVERLLKRNPDWSRSISVTTRKPRIGEKTGIDYQFVSHDEFSKMDANGQLLESAQVFDQYYGTPNEFVRKKLSEGFRVVLAIDVQGMKKIIQRADAKLPVFSIFVLPPSLKILRERLEGRKTDTSEQIERRLAIAQDEIKHASEYNCTVMNQQIEQTVSEIESLVKEFEKKRRNKSNAIRTS
jgi:guanylate kinase